MKQPPQCEICIDQRVLFEAEGLELRGFFVVERILKSYFSYKGSTYFGMWFKAFFMLSVKRLLCELMILMFLAFRRHQKPKYWIWGLYV